MDLTGYTSLINYYKRNIALIKDVNSMYGLGFYYQFIEKNVEQMETYYFMALKHGDRDSHINYTNKYKKDIALGCIKSMLKLGYYYQYIYVDHHLMIKYYTMAIENGSVEAMNRLGYYFYLKKEYDIMKIYYHMAIEKGHILSMHELGYYYEKIKNYELMQHYYLMSSNDNLVCYYNETGAHLHMNRYTFINYLNRVPLHAVGLDKLVFNYQFQLYDELNPLLRKFIHKVHHDKVLLFEQTNIFSKNVGLIRHGYLSVDMSTKYYMLCKNNIKKKV